MAGKVKTAKNRIKIKGKQKDSIKLLEQKHYRLTWLADRAVLL